MEVDKLVKYLRLSVKVQDSSDNTVEKDSKYIEMSDDDLALILEVVATRNYKLTSLNFITSEMVYPLTLLAKKELFFTLAVTNAPLFNMTADNNNQLYKEQRFNHYMKLIEQVDAEFNQYMEDGGSSGTNNTLTTYDVLLTTRYTTKRNWDKGERPFVIAYLDDVGSDYVCVHWDYKTNLFNRCDLYLSRFNIYDPYAVKDSQKILKGSTLVQTLHNAQQTKLKVSGLKPDTGYYLLVVVTNMTGLKGYYQLEFETGQSFDISGVINEITIPLISDLETNISDTEDNQNSNSGGVDV